MSESNVLEAIQDLVRKFDDLKEDVETLKRDRERSSRPSRSRSRSPHRESPSSGHGSAKHGTPRSRESTSSSSWASRMEEEEANVHHDRQDSDEEGDGTWGGPDLVEVSEWTGKFLTNACTRSVSNEARRRTRGRYQLPKVAATKAPNLDPFMRTEVPPAMKTADRELAKIQSFTLDALAPLTALVEKTEELSAEETRDAALTAIELIGNANARMSRLRREKIMTSVNKSLLPLAKDDENFTTAAPLLFGGEFAKKSKDFLDQVKAIRSTLPAKNKGDYTRKPFFRGPPPSKRGGVNRSRGGDSTNFRGRGRPQYSK